MVHEIKSQCDFLKMWTNAHVKAVSIRWLPHIILSPLQMEIVTKILIKMLPLSTERAILILVIDREAREIMHLVASVPLCVCLSVRALLLEPFDH